MREIRSLFRFIPFGKFSLSGRGRPPFNQVYVGRQRERSNFIELLTHQEKFGAFLISGHRGAGKSSFVDYCLNEYERMAFQRSIRISRGGQLMSRLNLTIVAILIIAFYVLLSQFLELAAQNTFEALLSESISRSTANGLATTRVLWMIIPLLVGSIVMLIPAILVLGTAKAISETQNTPWERAGAFWLSLLLMLVVPLGWLIFWQLGASVDIKHLFFGFVWMLVPLMAMSQLIQAIGVSGKYNRKHLRTLHVVSVVLTLISGVIALFFKRFDLADLTDFSTTFLIRLNVDLDDNADIIDESGVSLVFYAATYFAVCATAKLFWVKPRPTGYLILGALFSLAFAGLFFGSSSACILRTDLTEEPNCQTFSARLIGLCPLAILFSLMWIVLREKNAKADPGIPFAPMRAILIFKANFFFLLTLLGLLPLLRVVLGFFVLLPSQSLPDEFEWLQKRLTSLVQELPHLEETHIEAWAFLTILAIAALIYRCEYLWICRDQRSFRQDYALGMLGRAQSQPDLPEAWPSFPKPEGSKQPWDWLKTNAGQFDGKGPPTRDSFANLRTSTKASPLNSMIREPDDPGLRRAMIEEQFGSSRLSARSRYVFRKLESVTLPYWIYSVRHPVMKLWINLGFDNLEHSRIVEAMLRRLRGAYKQRFLSVTSVVGGMNAMFLVGAAILVTSLASKSIFHIGNLSDYDRGDAGYTYRFEGNTVSSRDTFGATNFCGFFEVYPEIAPVAKSFVCALPFANGIMELLYAPVLQIHTDFRSEIATQQTTRSASMNWAENTVLCEDEASDEQAQADATNPEAEAEPAAEPEPGSATQDQRPIAYMDWSDCIGDDDVQESLYEMFVGGFPESPPENADTTELTDSTEGTDRNLVGDSELVRFILDPNIGLPLIDYETNVGRTTLGDATWVAAFSPYPAGEHGTPTLRVYHVLLYVLAFMLLFALNRRLRLLPYQANIDAMDELILLINGRETLQSGDQHPRGFWANLWPFQKKERTIETAVDPRVVEQRFIELLERLRPDMPSYQEAPLNAFEVCPEITFVFDEMDKLSGIVDPELSKEAEGQTQLEENNRERARSLQLHQLLSDMKRLISGNAARFIFIGGRLYHDEWLADQAQRAPILNSIFSGQIYLPSLMADRNHTFGRMNDRVTELVVLMYRNARHRYHTWKGLRRAGAFIPAGTSEEPSYVQFELPFSSHPRRLSALAHFVDMKVIDAGGKLYSINQGSLRAEADDTGAGVGQNNATSAGPHAGRIIDQIIKFLTTGSVDLSSGEQKNPIAAQQHGSTDDAQPSMGLGEQETFDQFINFLTYRSAGNPKKLKELIQSMMQTSSHAFALSRYPHENQADVRWNTIRHYAHDVITLNDPAIYRMQFIDMLYRHLTDHIEGRMLERDDKVSMSIFYLMDFLMKFHNRGFSRTNLQRVDELSHIHRAPDLRSVMSLLVQVSSERFLHRVQNGVYNFRFRSDFAREIDYLSRISKEEMAALNFTLDESQSLKGLYQQTINTGERENIDTISGLGELYEYDQEHEIARNYYRRAIAMLDDVQANSVMAKAVRHSVPAVPKDKDAVHFQPSSESETDAGRSYAEFGMFGDLLAGLDSEERHRLVVSQVHWVVARLRLMLQIGQTYEQEQNFERAYASYIHSARFSNIVLDALASDRSDDEKLIKAPELKIYPDHLNKGPEDKIRAELNKKVNDFWKQLFGEQRSVPLVVLRNLAIFYQAGFAAAWVLEKDPENIDDSVVYAESWVKRIYDREPLLKYALPKADIYPMTPPFSGNILIQGALAHDRLGDLYFMKGQQSMRAVPFETIVESVKVGEDQPQLIKRTGYMMRAQYNYAMSLWLLRKYLTNRNRISKVSWATFAKRAAPSEPAEPFEIKSITSSQFHVTYADALTDLAESIFATRSALRLSRDLCFPNSDGTPYDGPLCLGDLRLYGDCLRALVNDGISRFNDNLIATDAYQRADSNALNWIADDTSQRNVLLDLKWISDTGGENSPVLRKVIRDRWNKIDKTLREHLHSKDLSFGKISQWVGRRKIFHATKYQKTPPHMDGLKFDPPKNEMERLMGYKFFSQAAARANQAIGQSTNSAHEYFLQADALNSTLWDARVLSHLHKHKAHKEKEKGAEKTIFTQLFKAISGNGDAATKSDADLFHIGVLSLTSIKDAVKRIQFSDRPSTTRLALNHGNPDRPGGLMDATGTANSELRADYDMAQAFRDDPRAITYACSLILALLDEKAGRLCIGLALMTYKDVLMKYAHDTFKPKEDGDDLEKILAEYLEGDRNLPGDTKTYSKTKEQLADEEIDLKTLSKALYRETYAGLCVSLERYRYPILNRLNGLKVLADALLLQDPEEPYKGQQPSGAPDAQPDHLLNRFEFAKHFGTERNSQIGRFVRELAMTGDVYGSDLHFPVDRAGQTMALTFIHMKHYGLHAIYDDMIADPPHETDDRYKFLAQDEVEISLAKKRPMLNETILTRESVGEMAVNRLGRSHEATSMGDSYYENVGYLSYLNDDFNDRSIHYYHATTMAHADLSELLSLIVKAGFN